MSQGPKGRCLATVKGMEEKEEFPFLAVYSYLCLYPKTGNRRGSANKVIEEITFRKISTMNNT